MVYYEELAHMIIEAQKAPVLLSACWRPRKTGGVLLKMEGLRAQVPVWRQETNVKAQAARQRKGYILSFSTFCSIQAFNWLDEAHHTEGGFPSSSNDKESMRETWVQALDQEDPLEKGMATYSNIFAWRIPLTEEPGMIQSMGVAKCQTRLSKYYYLTGDENLLYSIHQFNANLIWKSPHRHA